LKLTKLILLFIISFLLYSCDSLTPNSLPSPPVPKDNETVMTDGMKIIATTRNGTITIKADKGLKRSYTWEGETRSVIMYPRKKRWFGSMGLYYPGPGNHWKEHNGIRRGVLEEGKRYFDSEESAFKWLRFWYGCSYRDDGLAVCYSKQLDRSAINVDVWQIYIGGTVPSKFQETAFQAINSMNWPEEIKETYRPICYIDGRKPTKLRGSQNDIIKVQGTEDGSN
jgi:hypothetical protein